MSTVVPCRNVGKLRAPVAIARPRTVMHLQQCVAWAATHGIPLSIIRGGHSVHFTWDGALAISMERFASVEVDPITGTRRCSHEVPVPVLLIIQVQCRSEVPLWYRRRYRYGSISLAVRY